MVPFSRVLQRLGQDQAQLEADDLARTCHRDGGTRVSDLRPRHTARVTGTVHSVAVQPAGAPPQLQVELYDGTGILLLTWLGRRQVDGIEPGVFLRVSGRVTEVDDQVTIFNPAYELLPHHG
jgi:RecG-like helicase